MYFFLSQVKVNCCPLVSFKGVEIGKKLYKKTQLGQALNPKVGTINKNGQRAEDGMLVKLNTGQFKTSKVHASTVSL